MATNFFFKSLAVNRYRGLKKLNIERLTRVNIIGGVNGTGKSTLLDLIFLILDRQNPVSLLRPFASRNLAVPYPDGLNYIFGRESSISPIEIEFKSTFGDSKLTLFDGPMPNTMNIAASSKGMESLASAPIVMDRVQKGIHIKLATPGRANEAACVILASSDAVNYNLYEKSDFPVVPGAYLSSTTRASHVEDAQRYSILVRERRTIELVGALQFVNAELHSFHLLQDGAQPTLYAQLHDESMIQVSLMGGGFQSMLSLALVMMTTRDGIVLFDEIDSTIHYSKLKFFWTFIANFASRNNCQVFAVTHSRECIANAAEGAFEAGRIADMQYIRLENDDGDTDVISYSGTELRDATASGWEIR